MSRQRRSDVGTAWSSCPMWPTTMHRCSWGSLFAEARRNGHEDGEQSRTEACQHPSQHHGTPPMGCSAQRADRQDRRGGRRSRW